MTIWDFGMVFIGSFIGTSVYLWVAFAREMRRKK